jgi:hypothetical protein
VEHSEYRWLTLVQARDLLSYKNSAEAWLLKVIEQAEIAKKLLPAAHLAARQSRSFELDVRNSG